MPDEEDNPHDLIARAKGDTEACQQLRYWTQQLMAAQEARRKLLDLPAEDVLAALERQP